MRTSSQKEKNTALSTVVRLLTTLVLLVFLFVAVAVLIYVTIPMRNTQRTHFDAIIVLGCPSKPDGTPSECERARVDEGVREYRAGMAPHIIMTGGPAHNRYVEAQVMGTLAETEGVPDSAVIEEKQAQDTIQNAYYSVRIMRKHGWHSAEVVSEPSHLRRASLIFSHFPIAWRMNASPWPADYSFSAVFHHYWREMKMTDRLRLFGFGNTPYLP